MQLTVALVVPSTAPRPFPHPSLSPLFADGTAIAVNGNEAEMYGSGYDMVQTTVAKMCALRAMSIVVIVVGELR